MSKRQILEDSDEDGDDAKAPSNANDAIFTPEELQAIENCNIATHDEGQFSPEQMSLALAAALDFLEETGDDATHAHEGYCVKKEAKESFFDRDLFAVHDGGGDGGSPSEEAILLAVEAVRRSKPVVKKQMFRKKKRGVLVVFGPWWNYSFRRLMAVRSEGSVDDDTLGGHTSVMIVRSLFSLLKDDLSDVLKNATLKKMKKNFDLDLMRCMEVARHAVNRGGPSSMLDKELSAVEEYVQGLAGTQQAAAPAAAAAVPAAASSVGAKKQSEDASKSRIAAMKERMLKQRSLAAAPSSTAAATPTSAASGQPSSAPAALKSPPSNLSIAPHLHPPNPNMLLRSPLNRPPVFGQAEGNNRRAGAPPKLSPDRPNPTAGGAGIARDPTPPNRPRRRDRGRLGGIPADGTYRWPILHRRGIRRGRWCSAICGRTMLPGMDLAATESLIASMIVGEIVAVATAEDTISLAIFNAKIPEDETTTIVRRTEVAMTILAATLVALNAVAPEARALATTARVTVRVETPVILGGVTLVALVTTGAAILEATAILAVVPGTMREATLGVQGALRRRDRNTPGAPTATIDLKSASARTSLLRQLRALAEEEEGA